MARVLVLMAILAASTPVDGARILYIMSMPSPSHFIFNRALSTELARRGHDVTVLANQAEKQPLPNYREIIAERAYDGLDDSFPYVTFTQMSRWEEVSPDIEWGVFTCDNQLKSEGARTLLQMASNETFDLIVFELSMNECLLGFITKFGNPPVIGISPYPTTPWIRYTVGNFLNPSYINTYILPYTDHMTFLQRMDNFLMDTYVWWYWRYSFIPRIDEMSRKFYGESIPPVLDIQRNISLVMLNMHYSTHFPQPELPGVIPVAGMHISPPKPLPKDIQKYLDESKNGVVYFNFGTNILSAHLGSKAIRAFLDAFSELPQNVLWKFESESLEGKPDNVMIRKWLPQNDILAHPNVKAFISHGGLLSISEAMYHGVPFVGVPFMMDQYPNMAASVAKGVAVKLEFQDISKESVLEALDKVLNDSSFRERALEQSSVFRDRPQTPLDTAVFWTEYALRHRGARFLRCASLDLAWYQRLLIDVIAAIVLGIAAVATALYMAARYLVTLLCGTKKSKVE